MIGEWLASNVLPLAATFLAGALGWIGTHFLANPLLEFYRLRSATYEQMFFTANVGGMDVGSPRYNDAVAALRRQAAQIDALRHTALPPILLFLRWRGYDLKAAKTSLVAMSNNLARDGTDSFLRAKRGVIAGLCLPDPTD